MMSCYDVMHCVNIMFVINISDDGPLRTPNPAQPGPLPSASCETVLLAPAAGCFAPVGRAR